MISIAICEDDIDDCLHIKRLIQPAMEKQGLIHTICCFFSGKELLESMEGFDIIFLDIKMEGGNGMETAHRLRARGISSLLIFVTAYEEYLQEGFDVEAFHYLLKPLDEEKLLSVFQRAIHKTRMKRDRFLVISSQHQQIKLFFSDILYIEVFGRLCRFHTKGNSYTSYEKLSVLEEKVGKEGWVRVHKSYLVNLQFVKGFSKQEVTLSNEEKIPLSKRRWHQFQDSFLSFAEKEGGIL